MGTSEDVLSFHFMSVNLPHHEPNEGARSTRATQARSVARRLAILEATLRIVARDGVAGVTHRTVAAEAGVPVTSTTYYFESKPDLIAEAFRLHAERESARVSASTGLLAGQSRSVETLADRLSAFVCDGLAESRTQLIAEFELLMEATRRPELARLSKGWYEGMEHELALALRELHSPDPALDSRILLSVLAGLEVGLLAESELDESEIHRLVQRLTTALLEPKAPPT